MLYVLYVLEWRLATGLSSHVVEFQRFIAPSLADILEKLGTVPDLLRSIHSGSLQVGP